jgi:hypothetical protein
MIFLSWQRTLTLPCYSRSPGAAHVPTTVQALLAGGATGALDSKWPGSERAAARGWCRLVELRDGPADSRPSGSLLQIFHALARGAVDWFDWLESTSYVPVPSQFPPSCLQLTPTSPPPIRKE